MLRVFLEKLQQFQKKISVHCGRYPFLKGKSYFEMQSLSPILNLGILYSRSCLLLQMCKKLEFPMFFDIKSIEQLFWKLELWRTEIIVPITFHVTLNYSFQGTYCAFSKCSLSLTPCSVSLYSHGFAQFFKPFCKFRSVVDPKFFCFVFSLIMVKNAWTVSLKSFAFVLFASTVLWNRSWQSNISHRS